MQKNAACLISAFVLTIIMSACPACARVLGSDGESRLNRVPPLNASISYTEDELEKIAPKARPGDVSSPEAIIKALHEAASGAKGNWDPARFRSLCVPNVLFEYDDKDKSGIVRVSTITLNTLVDQLKALHQSTGWYEKVINTKIVNIKRDTGTVIATALQTGIEGVSPSYKNDPRKTSTATLIYIGKRWWVLSQTW